MPGQGIVSHPAAGNLGADLGPALAGLFVYLVADRKHRLLHAGAMLLCLAALVQILDRTSLLGFAAAGAVMFILAVGRSRVYVAAVGAGLFALLLISAQGELPIPGGARLHNVWLGLSSGANFQADPDAQFRLRRWRSTADVWMTSPVFGVGFGAPIQLDTWGVTQGIKGAVKRGGLGAFNVGMPHNSFLVVLARMGLIGLRVDLLCMGQRHSTGHEADSTPDDRPRSAGDRVRLDRDGLHRGIKSIFRAADVVRSFLDHVGRQLQTVGRCSKAIRAKASADVSERRNNPLGSKVEKRTPNSSRGPHRRRLARPVEVKTGLNSFAMEPASPAALGLCAVNAVDSETSRAAADDDADAAWLAKGSAIVLAGGFAGQALQFSCQIVLARLLGPAQFGLYGIGWTLFRLVGPFAALGLNAGVIYGASVADRSDTGRRRDVLLQSLVLGLLAGGVIGAAAYIGAPWVCAEVFGKSELTAVIRSFALALPLLTGLMVASASTKLTLSMVYSTITEMFTQPALNLLFVFVALHFHALAADGRNPGDSALLCTGPDTGALLRVDPILADTAVTRLKCDPTLASCSPFPYLHRLLQRFSI